MIETNNLLIFLSYRCCSTCTTLICPKQPCPSRACHSLPCLCQTCPRVVQVKLVLSHGFDSKKCTDLNCMFSLVRVPIVQVSISQVSLLTGLNYPEAKLSQNLIIPSLNFCEPKLSRYLIIPSLNFCEPEDSQLSESVFLADLNCLFFSYSNLVLIVRVAELKIFQTSIFCAVL